jgi:hypothetical protein
VAIEHTYITFENLILCLPYTVTNRTQPASQWLFDLISVKRLSVGTMVRGVCPIDILVPQPQSQPIVTLGRDRKLRLYFFPVDDIFIRPGTLGTAPREIFCGRRLDPACMSLSELKVFTEWTFWTGIHVCLRCQRMKGFDRGLGNLQATQLHWNGPISSLKLS